MLLGRLDAEYQGKSTRKTAIDYLPLSYIKYDLINTLVPKYEKPLNYYIPLLEYHNRWKSLGKRDFGILDEYTFKGHYSFLNRIRSLTPSYYENDTIIEPQKLSDKTLKYLLKIIELAKRENIKLILTKLPIGNRINDIKYWNYIEDIV